MKRENVPILLLVLALVALGASGIEPTDRLTWLLEVSPVMIGVAIVVPTYRRFPLSHLLYTFLFVHSVILVVGGHYTYAHVPAGLWLQDLFDLSRNHYDRLGHFAQGFIPALLAREILKRCSPLGQSRWLPFLVVCVCLAFSAFYELIEWWVSLALGQAAGEFLGTQGDVWDTQWDMFLALVGACVSLIALGRAHDRSLAKLGVYPPRDPG
jgi:putative membrane protein